MTFSVKNIARCAAYAPLTLAMCINRSSNNNAIFKKNGVLCVNTLSRIYERYRKSSSQQKLFGRCRSFLTSVG